MTKLNCPFCGHELRKIHPTYVICDNCRITGEDKLWQELIKLMGKNERTRKALEIAVDALKIAQDCCSDYSIECLAHEALEQITADHFADVSKKIEQKVKQ